MAKVNVNTLEIRLLRREDLERITRIDSFYTGHPREDYCREKIEKHLDTSHQLDLSFAAVLDGKVIGFLMGEVSRGSYGLPEKFAAVDTIGVDKAHAESGIGRALMNEFVSHAGRLGIEKVYTLVRWEEEKLLHFFRASGFSPGGALYLEKKIQ